MSHISINDEWGRLMGIATPTNESISPRVTIADNQDINTGPRPTGQSPTGPIGQRGIMDLADNPIHRTTTGGNFDIMDLIDDPIHGTTNTTGNYIINNDLSWVDSIETSSTSSLSVSIQDANGEWITTSWEDMYNDNQKLKKKNEELEARLYKLEEKFRFLTEI